MSKYLIQTRNEIHSRNIVGNAISSAISGNTDWITKNTEYADLEKAKQKCISFIENGMYKAGNIRVIEVVSTFSFNVTTNC